MAANRDPQRRPVYIDRVNNRFLADPAISNTWPVIQLVPGMFGDAPANALLGRYGTSGPLSYLDSDVTIDLINAATSSVIAAARIASASTTGAGVVQLEDSVGSTSTSTAATPNAVKTAYDLASSASSTASTAASTANAAASTASAAQSTANAALPKAGGTMTGEVVLDEIKEKVHTLPTSGSIALDPANGSIQSSVLTGAPTFTDSLEAGQTVVLMIENGASYLVTWPTITWVSSGGNTPPTLTAKDALVLWKISTILYGAYAGSYA